MEDKQCQCSGKCQDDGNCKKDIITKTIRRLINTASYESVEFTNTITREMSYVNDSERQGQHQKIRDEMEETLKEDISQVMAALGLSEKRAFVRSQNSIPSILKNTDL